VRPAWSRRQGPLRNQREDSEVTRTGSLPSNPISIWDIGIGPDGLRMAAVTCLASPGTWELTRPGIRFRVRNRLATPSCGVHSHLAKTRSAR
jgi:hypothetical protein